MMRQAPRTALLATAVAASLSAARAQQDVGSGELLVVCKRLFVTADTAIEPGEFLVRDGKVAFVGSEIPAEARARAKKATFADATIVPGFVLAHTTLALERELAERAVALTPDMLAKDAFDPADEKLADLPRHGVTSAVLSPSSSNVAGGIAAIVEPGSHHGGKQQNGTIRANEAYAKFALIPASRNPERQPTSLMGAVDMLRNAFQDARTGALAGEAAAALNAVARGERKAVFHADTRAEILAVLSVCKPLGIEPVIAGAADASECTNELAAARASLILGNLLPEARDERLMLPKQLEEKGIPFCFTGDPSLLRSSAALAVAYGCSRKIALAAITSQPARICGAESTHGALRTGCDADFAVFSGDPLDLTSRPIAVYGNGALLHGGPDAATKTTTKEPK
jgi:imidazolonepropionase-like amidohydrolase